MVNMAHKKKFAEIFVNRVIISDIVRTSCDYWQRVSLYVM